MHNNSSVQLNVTDYFLQNTTFLLKLERVSRRIPITVASDLSDLSEKAINEFETGDQKEGCVDTLIRLANVYGIVRLRTTYTSVPPQKEWKELTEKGRQLGNELRCKNIPRPGSGMAAKPHDERWLQWGKEMRERFDKRVGKGE